MLTKDGRIADPYRNFIALSRYARWREEDGRRETWTETVDRWVDFMNEHVDIKPQDLADVREAILNHEVMPSMRGMMTAGPALERNHIAIFNCFSGDQEYITADGIKTFAETVGTTQTVLNGQGEWVEAPIKEFGVQPLQRVSFRPGHRSTTKVRRTVDVTPDHRWITVNRGEVTDLRVGDRVKSIGAAPMTAEEAAEKYPEAFAYGLGFGDGTLDTLGYARIRLCGAKAKWVDHLAQFDKANVMYPPSQNGDPIVTYHKGPFQDWKELPPETWSPEELAAWFLGYLEMDGSKYENDRVALGSQDHNALDFAARIAPYAGYVVVGDNTSSVMETNYGRRKNSLRTLLVAPEVEFIVKSIEDLEVTETVYCAVVPETQDFALVHGIHTGNCSYLPVDSLRSFDEVLYILSHGTGVGFSVESFYVNQLPEVAETFVESDTTIVVADSKEGWQKAFRELLALLWAGQLPDWDISKIRPRGARLKTFGGTASGPGPLVELFEFATKLVYGARGRKLTALEAHDLVCKVGDVIVSGGVRRSALISLSDLNDIEMSHAKAGAWWDENGQRALANNSAVYHGKPSMDVFMTEWKALYDSKSGERGLVNRKAMQEQSGASGRRDPEHVFGTNPCCVTADTILMTTDGPQRIDSLQGKPFTAIVDGKEYAAPHGSWISGTGSVYELRTREGHSLKLTPEHRILTTIGWVEAQNIPIGSHIRVHNHETGEPRYATVESFDYVGEEEVWDAEVSEVHAFDANGIYAHNSEIILRPYQFCNLSEVVVRADDTMEDLERKARLAALIGTWQSTFTNFKNIRKVWKNNTEEERLLGVSMTGVFGNSLTNGVDTGLEERLEKLRDIAVDTNRVEAERLDIPQSTAVTCVKPSGTVSQLTGTSSGLHTWHNEHYIRTVRGSNDDPITQFLKDVGIPAEPDVMAPDKTTVFSFPVEAPEGAITRKDLTAVEHLELWLTYQRHWCEHKPSVTISVKEDEWLEVGAWVYEHFDEMSGVSFLPYSEHTYLQAPYQDIDSDSYQEALENMPDEIRWEDLSFYEFDDGTTGSQELACSSGACEIVDIS